MLVTVIDSIHASHQEEHLACFVAAEKLKAKTESVIA